MIFGDRGDSKFFHLTYCQSSHLTCNVWQHKDRISILQDIIKTQTAKLAALDHKPAVVTLTPKEGG